MYSKKAMQTLEDVFREFGGPSKVGQALGISTEHAAAMKRRKSIPPRYWAALVRVAKERGLPVSYDALAEIHAQERVAS